MIKVEGEIYIGYSHATRSYELEFDEVELEGMNEAEKNSYIDQAMLEYALENYIEIEWKIKE
ncbi:MAG: hypothetical protein Q8910_00135 [Bacteroidota bacterium]|nr:hypothetical protein [Bacteroidota bacterium]